MLIKNFQQTVAFLKWLQLHMKIKQEVIVLLALWELVWFIVYVPFLLLVLLNCFKIDNKIISDDDENLLFFMADLCFDNLCLKVLKYFLIFKYQTQNKCESYSV